MFDLGDDIVIESYRIPWLIWIQLVVMFLLTLTILLSYFGFFALDSSSAVDSLSRSSPRFQTPSSCSQRVQVVGNPNPPGERATSTTNTTRRVEINSERDGCSVTTPAPTLVPFFHPCRYLDLAKQAFLKCLGLGSGSQNSCAREQEHED